MSQQEDCRLAFPLLIEQLNCSQCYQTTNFTDTYGRFDALKQNVNVQMVSDPSGGNITFHSTADSYNKRNIIKKCMCKYDESMYPERFFVGQISQ